MLLRDTTSTRDSSLGFLALKCSKSPPNSEGSPLISSTSSFFGSEGKLDSYKELELEPPLETVGWETSCLMGSPFLARISGDSFNEFIDSGRV